MTDTNQSSPPFSERFEHLGLERIMPSETNPRTHFDDAYIAELSRSIVDKGVIQPILVRPIGDGERFEIIAGECRYRGSKLANANTIPAVIRDYTDEQVLELQLIENIHRKDLTPLEQAVGYRKLIDANPTKHSAESIATRIGMSVAWVWDRLKLNDLIDEAKEILEQELMTVGHAILIARLKPEDQARVVRLDEGRNQYGAQRDGLWQAQGGNLLDEDDETGEEKPRGKYDGVKAVSIRELESWIREHVRFDVAHMAKAVPLQFESTAAEVEDASAQPGRGKKVVSITYNYRPSDAVRNDGTGERIFGQNAWRLADGSKKSPACEFAVLGVVATGDHYGETRQVCISRDKCEVHYRSEIKEREKNRKLRESGQGKKADRNEAAAEVSRQKREAAAAQKRKDESTYWNGLVQLLRPAVMAHVAKLTLTPELFMAAVAKGSSNTAHQLKHRWGVKPTAKNLGTVAALVCIELAPSEAAPSEYSWNTAERQRAAFLQSAKAFKFNIGGVESKYKAELKAAAAKAAKK